MTTQPKKRLSRPKYTKRQFEKAAWGRSQLVCGIDEVGRGCLAGPLVTAAVILPINAHNRLIRDSKIMTELEREKAYKWLSQRCWFGVGIVHNRIIDKHNIWQANLLAMKRALIHALAICPQQPEAILVDAVPLTIEDIGWKGIPVHHFPKGESISPSIAAASIIAKVTRDRIMRRFNRVFPGYLLDEHKGYATLQHKNAIKNLYPSIIHRTSFLDTTLPTKDDHEEQQSLLDLSTVVEASDRKNREEHP